MCGSNGARASRSPFGTSWLHQRPASCCDSCSAGGSCEGGAASPDPCATGFCGVSASPLELPDGDDDLAFLTALESDSGERAAAGVFTDRFHDSATEALRALIAWKEIPAALWFSTTAGNREAWARSWVATLGASRAADRNEIVAAVLAVSPSQMGVTTRTGSTGTGSTGNASDVPSNWSTMTPAQRQAWAEAYANEHGMTARERADFAERARNADQALIRGLVTEGISLIRDLVRSSSDERIAEIEAQARVAGARSSSEREAAQTILDAIRAAQGQGGATSTGAGTGKKSGGGAGLGLLAAALLFARGF